MHLCFSDDAPPELGSIPEQLTALELRHVRTTDTIKSSKNSRLELPSSQTVQRVADQSLLEVGGRDLRQALRIASPEDLHATENCAQQRPPQGTLVDSEHRKVAQSASAVRPSRCCSSQATTLKKGFFNASKNKTTSRAAPTSQAARLGVKAPERHARSIPEGFMLKPQTPEEHRAAALDAMRPSRENIERVLKDKDLLRDFDDAEVMAAVADIADHPENAGAYARNTKVQDFYRRMGGLMEKQLSDLKLTS